MVDFAGTDSALDAIVRRLVPCVAPELILLFGSRAAGTARGDSDYDLMLVLRRPEAAVEPARRAAYDALHGLGVSVDVLACNVEQYERRQHDPGYLSWLMVAAEPSWEGICFHSHACVEKLLKALIVTQGVFPPRTHELPELLALQAPDIRDAAPLRSACALLMTVYPKSRYPEAGDPTPDETRSAIAAAREARQVLRASLER